MSSRTSRDDDKPISTFIWRIENFAFGVERYCEDLESPIIQVNAFDKISVQLACFPRGWDEEDSISFFFKFRKTAAATKMVIDYSLDILLHDNSLYSILEDKNHNITFKNSETESIKVDDVLSREELFQNKAKFLIDGALCFCFRIWRKDLNPPLEYGEWFIRTTINVERICFNWVVDLFKNIPPNQNKDVVFQKISSPICFKIYLSGGNVKLDIAILNSTMLFVRCKLGILSGCDPVQNTIEDEHWYETEDEKEIWHFPNLLTIEKVAEMKKSLWNGVLKLNCECSISTGVNYNEVESTSLGAHRFHIAQEVDCLSGAMTQKAREAMHSERQLQPSHTLQEDLQLLFQEKVLCDFKLKSGEELFEVHKSLLSARSSVFRAMFESDMQEAATDVANIEDINADTLKRMLKFIYTDQIERLDFGSVSKLYFAADKYDLVSLKKKCSVFLENNLSVSNACEVLVLADLHQDVVLKKAVQDFILAHDGEILCSKYWDNLEANNVQLAVTTVKLIYLKKLHTQK